MFKIQSHIKPPKIRRRWDEPKDAEAKAFDAFIAAYKIAHNCTLRKGSFDAQSRIQVFHGPTFTEAHSATRCKALTRQLKFRKD